MRKWSNKTCSLGAKNVLYIKITLCISHDKSGREEPMKKKIMPLVEWYQYYIHNSDLLKWEEDGSFLFHTHFCIIDFKKKQKSKVSKTNSKSQITAYWQNSDSAQQLDADDSANYVKVSNNNNHFGQPD